MSKEHIQTSNAFYDFLDNLPDKTIFVDTNIVHPGPLVTKLNFHNLNTKSIFDRVRKTNALATTLREAGNYRITRRVYEEITHIVASIERNREKAERLANRARNQEDWSRLVDLEFTYARALELAEEQQIITKEMLHTEQLHQKIRELITSVVAKYQLDKKTISTKGQAIRIPASSQTDIELVLTTYSLAETEPTGVLSLDKDIAILFALCSKVLYDNRSPFKGVLKSKPGQITAHFFYRGMPYNRDAKNICDVVQPIPERQENEFFEYLKQRHQELYVSSKCSGRFKITTLEDVALTE